MRQNLAVRPKRGDARRNEESVLDAAAEVFRVLGVEAPTSYLVARSGCGRATIYRHFPTRADLIIAVYRDEVDELSAAAGVLLASSVTPYGALIAWIDRFVEFLDARPGLAAAVHSTEARLDALGHYLLGRLEPACAALLAAATDSGELEPGQRAYELLMAIAGICAGGVADRPYDARRLVLLLVTGMTAALA